ncbi:MAG: hypothetical protein JWO57_626 [Pseudonocardiales bacterium]|nr:hypothetical protein [Pseudonocardiales bacterium]
MVSRCPANVTQVSRIRLRQLAGAAVLTFVMFAALAPSASADPLSEAVTRLRSASLYVDPGATANGAKVDQASVARVLPSDVKIAVLPDSAGRAITLANAIGSALGAGPHNLLTIGVITVTGDGPSSFRAASSRYCPGFADAQAQAAADAHASELQNGSNLTPTIEDFVGRLAAGPVDTGHCKFTAVGASKGHQGSGAGTVWAWIGGIAALGVVGVGGLVLARRRRRRRELDVARAKIMPYYDRLASDINTLDPGDDPKARQAMADASERFNSAGSQLATARTVDEYAAARRTVLEGLHATGAARQALGLDPGPELPPIDETAQEQLDEPREVNVQGQQFQGYPSYTPGAPYYFGGGWGVPGGWYQVPFWETLLLGSVLSGGIFGGGWGGGGYGAGYDAGYDAGQDSGQDSDSGGYGGGDFGGGSGGGDFGGGGGDFGGGGGGGGDFSGGS